MRAMNNKPSGLQAAANCYRSCILAEHRKRRESASGGNKYLMQEQ